MRVNQAVWLPQSVLSPDDRVGSGVGARAAEAGKQPNHWPCSSVRPQGKEVWEQQSNEKREQNRQTTGMSVFVVNV